MRPRSSGEGLEGWREGSLVVRLNAPPVEGAANAALVRLIAGRLGVAKGKVRIVAGERSRDKLLEIEGMTPEALAKALA